ALKQIFERTPLKEGDTIISLGDLVDGLYESYEVLDYLAHCNKIYNMIYVKGNHDEVFEDWIDTGVNKWNWHQGQLATAKSYMKTLGIEDGVTTKVNGWIVKLNPGDIPQSHINIFKSQVPYYKDEKNNLFIHGGFNRHFLLREQLPYVFYWDRDLWSQALSWKSMSKNELNEQLTFKIKEDFNEIFIGHTTTMFWKTVDYMKAANIYNLDTGAG